MSALPLGQRVATCYGPGTVHGFEDFDARGRALPLSLVPTAWRVAVALDDPSRWSLSAPGVLPHFWPHELEAQQ